MSKTNGKGIAARVTALCYARKSLVKRGGVQPASPEMQADAVETRARALQLVPELYTDAEGWRSGRDENREAWQKLRARIGDPDVAAVIVYSWDRAVRNTELLLRLARELDELGVRFISLSDNIDTTTANGRFQLTIVGGVGEYESNIAGERRVGTIDYLRRHKGRHFGTVPFGADRIQRDGDLVLMPTTRLQANGTDHQALTRVYELYAGGSLSMQRIAQQLNHAGWRFRGRHGELKPFAVKNIRTLLYNHWLYAGYVVIGRAYQGDYEVVPGSHGPLLPAELTQAVAARYAAHRRGWHQKRPPYAHPLTGILYCACDQRLEGSTKNGQRLYRHVLVCELDRPFSRNAAEIEESVRLHLMGLPYPTDLVERDAERAARALARSESGRSTEAERTRIMDAIDRLADLYAEGEITRDQYQAKKTAYLAQFQALEADVIAGAPPDAAAVLSLTGSIAAAEGIAFRNLVRALYARIEIDQDGDLRYHAQEWCQAWA